MLRMLLLLPLLTGVAAATDCLVLIEGDYRQLAEAPQLQDVAIARIAEDYIIVVRGEGADPGLPPGEVLDCADSPPVGYINVWPGTAEGRQRAAELGTILLERDDYLLIRMAGDLPPDFTLAGIRAITPLRVQRAPAAAPAPPAHAGRDPIVADIVAAVSEPIFQAAIQGLEDYGTRNARTTSFADACNATRDTFLSYGLAAEIQEYIAEPWYGEEFTCWNVIGEKPGVEAPEQIYIVCGHLDSTAGQPWTAEPVAPGADDNASGSSVALEAARVMAAHDFRHTVRFICFGAEEQGLCGSTVYAEQAAAAGEEILGVINLDMILYAPPGGETLRVYYDGNSEALAMAIDDAAAAYVPELDVAPNYNPGAAYSDHYPFWQNGYAAVQACEIMLSSNPYYHTTSDRLANYMAYFPYGTRCAKAAIAALATLAGPVGTSDVAGGETMVSATPQALRVRLWPNPAWGATQVSFDAPRPGTYELGLYDPLGRRLQMSLGSAGRAGEFRLKLDLDNVLPGVYLIEAAGEGLRGTRRMIVSP